MGWEWGKGRGSGRGWGRDGELDGKGVRIGNGNEYEDDE